MLGCVCGAAGYLLNFAAGSNIVLLMIAGALYGLGGLPIAYISGMLILDCAEYNALKGMARAEGTMTAFSSFGSKLGQGIGSALLGVLLGAAAFDGNLAADAQAESALIMIRSLYSIIPAIMFMLILLLYISINWTRFCRSFVLKGSRRKLLTGGITTGNVTAAAGIKLQPLK